MAERRMFAKSIIDSDLFLDMPLSTQALYFHLAMRADDDGFINNPKKIKRMIGASDDDLKLLIAKQFLIPFESGVVVIKHWRIHNYIRKDTYKGTMYIDEKDQLTTKNNEEYELAAVLDTDTLQLRDELVTNPSRDRDETLTQDSIGKYRLGKDTLYRARTREGEGADPKKSTKFIPPTVEEVRDYCKERGNDIDAEEFVAFYESKGWMIGKNKMKNWKSAIITWENRRKQEGGTANAGTNAAPEPVSYDEHGGYYDAEGNHYI